MMKPNLKGAPFYNAFLRCGQCRLKLESRRQLQPSCWQRRHGFPEEMGLEVTYIVCVVDVIKDVECFKAERSHFAFSSFGFTEIKIARQPQIQIGIRRTF